VTTEQSRPGGEGADSGQIPRDIHFAQRRYNDYAQFSADEYNENQRFHLTAFKGKLEGYPATLGLAITTR